MGDTPASKGGTSAKLDWYRNRLRAMSAAETLHRATTAARVGIERLGLGLARKVPQADLVGATQAFVHTPEDLDPECYVARADRVLAGEIDLLGSRVQLPRPIDWNRNPLTGHQVPMGFGKTLDYRDPSRVGDIKYFWLLNRHHQLVHVAQAWALTREPRFLAGVAELLRSWIDQCRYMQGGNWTSSLELAIRLINWSALWALIGGAGSPLFTAVGGAALRDDWLRLIHQHGHFINGHFSRYSSANNHLIGEAAGLFVATVTWPCWNASRAWGETARRILEGEIQKQNAPDGVNREQSVFYQHFVLEFMAYAGLAADAARRPLSEPFWQRFEAMLDFITAIMDVHGHVPAFGDADDALVLPLAPSLRWSSFELPLTLAAVRCGRGDFARAAGGFSEQCRWLLTDPARLRFSEADAAGARSAARPRRCFPDGGYYVLGDALDTPAEVRIVVDAGRLGYTSIAAHGHADALSLWLSVAGQPILIDPGTYAYQADTRWRDYFRSTAAHNTLQVDGQSQAVSGGKFLWLEHYRADSSAWSSDEHEDRLVAWHDGYQRLADPVRHERTVRYLKSDRLIEITDHLTCAGEHLVERFWHFAETCDVSVSDQTLHARIGATELTMTAGATVPTLHRGEQSPIAGWTSSRFGHKAPTTTACWRQQIHGEVRLTTWIQLAAPAADPS